MKAHELFQRMSPRTASEVFFFLQKEEKAIYTAAIQGLANQRNLRAVFIERKPPNERYPWMQAALSRPVGNALASQILQAWLLGAHKPMLRQFLSSLDIAHQDDGTVEELPPCPPKDKIQSAIDELLAQHRGETVAIYLHAFREADSPAKWRALGEILEEAPQLQFPLPK
ncbi:MAG: hypothetical protein LC772_06495 [Chloroflexi bacterium]|nr:hypothetical protein [Chloroflexota bacterium]